MGVVMNIVSGAERLSKRYGVSSIGYVKVDIGGLSGVIPKYLTELWPLGTKDTSLMDGARDVLITELGVPE